MNRSVAANTVSRGAVMACLAAAGAQCVGAPPPAAPSPQELHAAQCAAALETSADALARQVRAGKKEMRQTVLETLQGGIAFFSAAYLEGGAQERRAQRLATEARAVQVHLPVADLVALQGTCLDEGRKLFMGAGGLERAVVSRHADLRMEKLVGK
jgi:hypothetical protein